MPNYGVPQAGSNWVNPGLNVTSAVPGDQQVFLFNHETPAAMQASIPVGYAAFGGSPFPNALPTFVISWDVAPSSFVLNIQGAWGADTNSNYTTINTASSTPYTWVCTAPYQNGTYYRARLQSNTGGSGLTVTMKP